MCTSAGERDEPLFARPMELTMKWHAPGGPPAIFANSMFGFALDGAVAGTPRAERRVFVCAAADGSDLFAALCSPTCTPPLIQNTTCPARSQSPSRPARCHAQKVSIR